MKSIVSISLGAKERDHVVEIELLGETVRIQRIGTDGDMKKAMDLIRQLDGKVDAFGLGGIDRYVYSAGHRYTIRDGNKLAKVAKLSPIVDGSGLKNSLERWVISYLIEKNILSFSGKKVLMVSAVDRFGMAEALAQTDCDVIYGDFIFVLGLPMKITTLKALQRLARVVAPLIVKLPFSILYPIGSKQHINTRKYEKYFNWADVIAGDFHYIHKHMPLDLTGKVMLTNTVTKSDVEELRQRNLSCLITTTPNLEGRSFATNVMEATLVALLGKDPETITEQDYLQMLETINFRPRVENLNSDHQKQVDEN
jgi:hypothetical protein